MFYSRRNIDSERCSLRPSPINPIPLQKSIGYRRELTMASDISSFSFVQSKNAQPKECFTLSDGRLCVEEVPILTDVPPNVFLRGFFSVCDFDSDMSLFPSVAANAYKGSFIGFNVDNPSSRVSNSLGKLRDIKFMSIFRFKIWWSTMWLGSKGSDLQMETQLLFLEGIKSYVLILPIIEAKFRSALHPGTDDNINVCVESGSSSVEASCFNSCVYVHCSDNPYDLMREAYTAIRVHLGTFRLREEKGLPNIIDKFGWCTWDAFYLTVNPVGVWDGVKELVEGGCPPRFLIIDDGWQSINLDGQTPWEDAGNLVFPWEDIEIGPKSFVAGLRDEFRGLDDVYVSHALCGPWGGTRPGTTHLRVNHKRTVLSPSLSHMMKDLAINKIVEGGIGLVHPDEAGDLFYSMHSHLAGSGITGVKVDVFHTLELLAENYGGSVELAKTYYEGLDRSLRTNFGGTAMIASMEQCNDFFFLGTKQISMARVGDDFWFQDPNGDRMGAYWLQGLHMIHCGYNSLWMGNFMQPDWDMFQSDHVCAEFHAASRAICGGPVYVSDSVGGHDFDLLKKLVLPDGTILRCDHYALPTRDCIFNDPLQDGATLLKLWNLNKYGGVIGVFNCQGAGWCPEERKIRACPQLYVPISGRVSPKDVEWSQKVETAAMGLSQQYVVYLNKSNKLMVVDSFGLIPLTVQPSCFEICTVVPVYDITGTGVGVKFAPIGLVNMFNSGGAIRWLTWGDDWVFMEVKGTGTLCAYATKEPTACEVNDHPVEFKWNAEESSVYIELPWTGGPLSSVRLLFSSFGIGHPMLRLICDFFHVKFCI